jgi:hypothetical protein
VHDLPVLLDQVLAAEPLWDSYRADLAYLSDFAVHFRYPGESADRSTALRARSLCRSFRNVARQSLGL